MLYLIFLCSIFIHEISHIIIGQILGYKLKKMCFFSLGFFINFDKNLENDKNIIKKIIIYISGPMSNFFICFLVWKLNLDEKIFYTNLILGIFNLIPIFPLDGGNILKEICVCVLNYKNGYIWSYYISKMNLCIISFIYSLAIIELRNISLFFIIIYLWYIDFKENSNLKKVICAYKVIEKTNI